MSSDSSILIGFLLFVAVASGYWLARAQLKRSGPEQREAQDGGMLVRGLRFPAEKGSDHTIEAFAKLAEIDSETLETHFALGNLFRRRGETERAIRVHQSIVARQDLPRAERDRALFALAEDYLRAGLLDRAEAFFRETTSADGLGKPSLTNLIGIYERQKDWLKAIEIRRRLARASGKANDPVLAHYYCELASESLLADEALLAREYLRKARVANPESVRCALLRAELAERSQDYRLAKKLLVGVAASHREFARLAISRLACLTRVMATVEEFELLLGQLLSDCPDLSLSVAHAAILDCHMNDAVSRSCFEQYVRDDRILGDILGTMGARPDGNTGSAAPAMLDRIRLVLRRLAEDGPRFGCVECGLTETVMVWRCRGCLAWDSTLPTANLKFDSHLGTAGYIQ